MNTLDKFNEIKITLKHKSMLNTDQLLRYLIKF